MRDEHRSQRRYLKARVTAFENLVDKAPSDPDVSIYQVNACTQTF